MASAKSRGHNRKAEMRLEAISTRRPRETDLCDQSKLMSFVELCGAVIRSHASSRQWTFELAEEYGECEK